MNNDLDPILAKSVMLSLAFLMAAMILALIRLLKGPSIPDRVISLDLIASLTIGVIAAYTILTHQPVFLDAAVLMAMVTFLGTVSIARYLIQRFGRSDQNSDTQQHS
jgi:multicomponent Na+:H+ antiporter subunit F